MKKIISLSAFVLVASLMMFGCTSVKRTGVNKKKYSLDAAFDVSSYMTNKSDKCISIDKIRQEISGFRAEDVNGKKVRVDEKVKVTFPEVSTVGILRIGGTTHEMTPQEAYENIVEYGNHAGVFADYKKEIRDTSSQLKRDESKEYPYLYPVVYPNMNKFSSGDGFFIDTKDIHVQMYYLGYYSASTGEINRYLGGNSFAHHDALGDNESETVTEGTYEEMKDEEFELTDGRHKISEMASQARKYFEKGTPYSLPEGISVDIPYVRVFSIKEKKGFDFNIRRTYNGVPFSYHSFNKRPGTSGPYVYDDWKQAYVISKKGVAGFFGDNESEKVKEIKKGIKEIIGVKEALNVLSDHLGDNVRFKVSGIEFVYCPVTSDDNEIPIKIGIPCWQIEGNNETTDQHMRFYVDSITEAIYSYSIDDNQ